MGFKTWITSLYDLPEIITEEYLDQIIAQHSNIQDIERIWQFCFRNVTSDISLVNPRLLVKCSFSKETNFPNHLNDMRDSLFELAKRKDFGLKEVHEKGVNGKGMHIAVIDQDLYLYNKEFTKNVVTYEDEFSKSKNDSMHANAVVDALYSIVPNATIHFFNTINDIESRISTLEYIYDYNKDLKTEDRILVISMSVHRLYCMGETICSDKMNRVIKKLEGQGCYLLDSKSFGDSFAISSPVYNNDFTQVIDNVYGEEWVIAYCKENNESLSYRAKNRLLVPGGGLLYAIPSTHTERIYCGSASYSWSIPIVAGHLLLAKSKNPMLSLEEFANIGKSCCDYNKNHDMLLNINNILQRLN